MKARIATFTPEMKKAFDRIAEEQIDEALRKGSDEVVKRGINVAFLAIAMVSPNISPNTYNKAKKELEEYILPRWQYIYKNSGKSAFKGGKIQEDTCCDSWVMTELERRGVPYFEVKEQM